MLGVILGIIAGVSCFSPLEGYVNREESAHRQEICLNGYWDFQAVELPADYRYGSGKAPVLPQCRMGEWDDVRIKIPSPWNVNAFANNNLEGPDHRNYPSYPESWNSVSMAWMHKSVEIPQQWNGQRINLHFEAVAGYAEVYVNGSKVAENFDIFLPFQADVTDFVKAGQKAEILVGVRSQRLFEDTSGVGRRIIPAGSMWGYHINGIWQDVYLLAYPQTYIKDVYIKPLVAESVLELSVKVQGGGKAVKSAKIKGIVRRWLNKAGEDVENAPVPAWGLGEKVLEIPASGIRINAGQEAECTIRIPVEKGVLEHWSPENPQLYAALLSLESGGKEVDLKYQRFGWRQWTLEGTKLCLNGKPYSLRGDSWHFMGIPQMTRRYAWAWFKAIKDMNGNAVRPHAQVYPRFYLDMADEMGICVLDETANWASDGGPKLDSPLFWENSAEHLRRFVERDRNHASVFGWSISNENKPVILYVHKRPDLMPLQQEAWKQWRDIVRQLDPSRPWISSDGEDDGDGILPVTVGHYGDEGSMRHWIEIGKPWGIGEHSMAYYGTPEEVSVYNGDRAYESMLGRMEGLANECYNLLAAQRLNGASYSTVFNMAWYGLQPLPLGKKDISTKPELEDGIFFENYKEGVPGAQPERIGPYSSTLNPGYDPSLPLYRAWPMFDAMRAANAPEGPAYSPWAKVEKTQPADVKAEEPYQKIYFIGPEDSHIKEVLDRAGVKLDGYSEKKMRKSRERALFIVDASRVCQLPYTGEADVMLWGINPQTVEAYNKILPHKIELGNLCRSSFLPKHKSFVKGMSNADFYFCEVQREDVVRHTLGGEFVQQGEVLLEACRTDWRKWNKRPEELKTAAVLRSENECTQPLAVIVKCGRWYVSTMENFTGTAKGAATFGKMLFGAGIPFIHSQEGKDPSDILEELPGLLTKPVTQKENKPSAVQWLSLNSYENDSTPLGNGSIATNVWTDSGEVSLMVANSDAGSKMHSCFGRKG